MKSIINFSILSLTILITSCMNSNDLNKKTASPTTSTSSIPSNQNNLTKPVEADLAIKTEENISYYKDKIAVKGFLAYPENIQKNQKYPAIILIHEFWGLNDYIKENAKKFAKKGYVVLASDLYEGKFTTEQAKAREYASSVRNNTEEAMKNLKNGIDFLKTREDVNSEKLASVGWCFGGGWSYQLAKNNVGVKASVMYYGNFNVEDDLKEMKAHIIGHFGEKDTSIKVDDVKQFQASLKTLSGDHEIYIYPNSGHGFANETNAPAYVKESADSAWERTMEFLKKNL